MSDTTRLLGAAYLLRQYAPQWRDLLFENEGTPDPTTDESAPSWLIPALRWALVESLPRGVR